MVKKPEKMVPEVRFKGFTDDWEQRKLQNIVSDKIQNGITNRSGKNSLAIKDINVIDLYKGDRIQASKLNYIDIDAETFKKYQASYNDVFLTRSSLKLEGIAQPNVLLTHGNFVFDDHIIKISPRQEIITGYFLSTLLSTNAVHKQFMAKAKTGSMTTIGQKDIQSIVVHIPKLAEQNDIEKVIFICNRIIDLQQRKLAQLKLLKKAMLQQLFASQNQVFPIARFKNFDGDWEQRKFEQFIEVEKKKNKSGFSYDPYSISNVDGFVPQNEQFGEGNTYSKTDKKSNYIVEPHSFAYNPARINVGSIGYQHFEKSVLVSSLYEIFKTKNDINDYFLWYWFHTRSFTDQVMKYQEGGVRQYYFIDKLKISKIKIPTFREQKLIAEFLRLLEINITLQQNKLTHLNKLKKFLLQKMFM